MKKKKPAVRVKRQNDLNVVEKLKRIKKETRNGIPLGLIIKSDTPAELKAVMKKWNELTIEEKLERMRNEVRNNSENISKILEIVTMLEHHRHVEQGRVAIPVSEVSRNIRTRGVRPDDWF